MIRAVLHTQKYFQPPKNYFWQWADHGEVIQWKAGATICYRDDLVSILRDLSLNGAPSLAPLLLILSACREKIDVSHKLALMRTIQPSNNILNGLIDDAIHFLRLINDLPDDCKTGRHRVHLLYEIFGKPGFVFSKINLRESIDELTSGRLNHLIMEEREEITAEQFMADLQCLSNALQNFPDAKSLGLKLRTGLDELPSASGITLPEVSPDLLDQLAEDPKTLGVSRLAKRLVAAFNIPMHSAISGDHSYGGITDITNRGNYDKLLLSELAHDNDLLMARLVNNEALYFRREEPPDNPRRQRTILVDTTIKMWGVPRVFAVSAGLAFAYNIRHGEVAESYALGGEQFSAIDLTTKEGVIAALGRLDHSLHCGNALQKLIHEIPPSAYNEFIFITEEKVFNNPAFQASLSQIRNELGFIVTLNREGAVWFYQCRNGRTKLLSTAKLDLEELLFVPSPTIRRQKPANEELEIAFLSSFPAPLLFPRVRIKMVRGRVFDTGGDGFVVVNESQRVLYIPKKDSGAYELLNYIPKGQYTFGYAEQKNFYLTVWNPQHRVFKFYHIDLFAGEVVNKDFSGEIKYITRTSFTDGKFLVNTGNELFLLDCATHALTRKVAATFADVAGYQAAYEKADLDVKNASGIIYPYNSTMYKIREIYISTAGELVLGNYTLKGRRMNNNIRIAENLVNNNGSCYSMPITVNRSALRNKGIKFSIRKWDDGSEAVIDSRGLLHLKSSNPSIPEISIVLVTGIYTACWSSDGYVCGSADFYDADLAQVIPVEDFYTRYIQRFIDTIREP